MMEKKSYVKPIIESNKIHCTSFMINSRGQDSVDNVGLDQIDDYYYLVLNDQHTVTDEMLWNYLDTNSSLLLCADKQANNLIIGSQTFTIDKNYSYTVTQGTPERDSEGNITKYYFDVTGTGETCSTHSGGH